MIRRRRHFGQGERSRSFGWKLAAPVALALVAAGLAASPGAAAPSAIVAGLLEAVRAFAAGAPQSDDITILAARYR